jgi:hypothetical protein
MLEAQTRGTSESGAISMLIDHGSNKKGQQNDVLGEGG